MEKCVSFLQKIARKSVLALLISAEESVTISKMVTIRKKRMTNT